MIDAGIPMSASRTAARVNDDAATLEALMRPLSNAASAYYCITATCAAGASADHAGTGQD